MPPFGRLAGIILSHPDQPVVEDYAHALARRAGPLQAIGAELFGPAPAPIARIRGRYRMRMLIHARVRRRFRRRSRNGWPGAQGAREFAAGRRYRPDEFLVTVAF
jgi:primosomal protein N'